MSLQIESDLHLEFDGHVLSLRDEGGQSLVAEFSSLRAVRRLKRSLPLRPGPLPPMLQRPGLDDIVARVVVRGRTVAVLDTRGHVASLNLSWWGLIATLLHLPCSRS
ncbi:MAG: hypothetical protein P8J86_12775 [Phycisphaerales bacterium]|nr:hypothetical protein [Phycisphaerales bacterium]